MEIIKVIVVAVILSIPAYATSFDEIAERWHGQYSYNALLGRTRGGDAIVYGIALTISPTGTCRIEEDGFQLMSRMSCYISETSSGINVNFKNYLPENIVDFGYKEGEKLFSLEHDPKRQVLITTWEGLEPEVKIKKGIFLKKLKKLTSFSNGGYYESDNQEMDSDFNNFCGFGSSG